MPKEQEQFLDVVDRDLAERRWLDAIRPGRLGPEIVPLDAILGRVLASDAIAEVDVPGFDRSNFDGYALRAEETFGASEEESRSMRLNPEELATGVLPRIPLGPGTATPIATGGMLPRGADAVAMIESTILRGDRVEILRPVSPGSGVTFAGTDIARGELVLRAGTILSSRESGVLGAIGRAEVEVVRRPRVAILSTGDEIVGPGRPLPIAGAFDANAPMLADAVREQGGEPIALGIVGDDDRALDEAIERGLLADVLILSGGTSKGAGDLSYRALARRSPGVIVHGVALKPGKPVCLGAVGSKPVAILPGFPTSAIFTFHEFVAPLLRRLSGRRADPRASIAATLPGRIESDRGRKEYVLVNLVDGPSGRVAYPLGKGSGSVTTFGRADGFVAIPRHQEYIEAGESVSVTPIGRGEPADLTAIGSHCVGLDAILGFLRDEGFTSKALWVGSMGGLAAASRSDCDLAGIHLLDPETDTYNRPFLPENVRLLIGYGRMQGLVFRPGDRRFEGKSPDEAASGAIADASCLMVNRNRGSGTRILIERLLKGARPPGFAVEARSHNAVAASVAQGRADWGVAIAPVAATYGLGFLPIRSERYDFAIPADRWDRPAVASFRGLLDRPDVRDRLASLGFEVAR